VSHRNERLALINKIELDYPRWWQLLQSEFSLLLYGFGSKKAVMEDFAHKWLMDGGVVVVNGGAVQVVSIKTLVESAPGFSALN
jgi:origin recognition complex subunit 2